MMSCEALWLVASGAADVPIVALSRYYLSVPSGQNQTWRKVRATSYTCASVRSVTCLILLTHDSFVLRDAVIQTQLKASATLAVLFMLYSLGALRFGFMLRQHISMYQIDYV